MKFAGRMNSFMFKGNYDLFQTIDAYRNLPGVTCPASPTWNSTILSILRGTT